MATDQEVEAQRAKTDAAREALRVARDAANAGATERDNDVRLEQLANEEQALQQQLNALTGTTAPAPTPTPEATPAARPARGADTDQEG